MGLDNSHNFDVLEARIKDNRRLKDTAGLEDIKERASALYRHASEAIYQVQEDIRRDKREAEKRAEYEKKINAENNLRKQAAERDWRIFYYDYTGIHFSSDGDGVYTLEEAMKKIEQLESRKYSTLKYIPVYMPEYRRNRPPQYKIVLSVSGERSIEYDSVYSEAEANRILRDNKYGPDYYRKELI